MTIAKENFNYFESLPCDLEYEDRKDYDQLGVFLADVSHEAVSMVETCPESVDSSIDFTFKDGSHLVLNNPRQWEYPAFCEYVRE